MDLYGMDSRWHEEIEKHEALLRHIDEKNARGTGSANKYASRNFHRRRIQEKLQQLYQEAQFHT